MASQETKDSCVKAVNDLVEAVIEQGDDPEIMDSYVDALFGDYVYVELLMKAFIAAAPSEEDRLTYLKQATDKVTW